MQFREVKPSRYRYINLVLFILAGLCNQVPTQAVSSIGPITRDLYKVSEIEVNLISMTNSILYPLVLFPTNYIIETYGLKIGSLIGQLFLCLGLILRLLVNQHFYFFIVGTYITGFGFCFLLSSPNKFAVNWFPVSQISITNSICIFAIFMSDSLGILSSAVFLDKHSSKQDFFDFFAAQTAIIVIVQILMAFFFKGQPKYPANYASQAPRESYRKSLKKLVKNRNYLILFGSMTFVFGSLNMFLINLSWIMDAYKFDAIQTAIIFIVAILAGLVGCTVTGSVFSNQEYRRSCIFFNYACSFSLVVLSIGLELHLSWLVYVGAAIFGLNVFPYLTTMTDFASETAFPVGETISGGSLILGGQIFGTASSILLTLYVFDQTSLWKMRVGEYVIIAVMTIGAFFLHKSKLILRRSQYEKQKKYNIVQLLTQSDNTQ